MSLNDTPRGDRLHIAIFGGRNAGKSSLINALTGQSLAIVSDTPGTTTDPVFKSMELHPIGPVVFIDTAGFDDEGDLGGQRVEKTRDIIRRTDLAILVMDGTALSRPEKDGVSPEEGNRPDPEAAWLQLLKEGNIPVIPVISKWDRVDEADRSAALKLAADLTAAPIPVSVATGEGLEELRAAVAEAAAKADPDSAAEDAGALLRGFGVDGGLVLLVMPQDIQAPKGRLILPQVQTIRELLDRKCRIMSTTADGFPQALADLGRAPDLIITDSQCFGDVCAAKPEESRLTSFSVLQASAKGDLSAFLDGAQALDAHVQEGSCGAEALASAGQAPFRVLIAEACTHVPLGEDIGTVKIPRLLQKTFGEGVEITNVRGNDFPGEEELKQFDLIIHCGACMFNRAHVLSRIEAARAAGVPITNYGIFLAKTAGILDKVDLP